MLISDEDLKTQIRDLSAEIQGHIHGSLRNKPTTKTFKRFYDRKLYDLQMKRTALQNEFYKRELDKKFALSRLEKLKLQALGHDDNAATQSARRLLAKIKYEPSSIT